MKTTPNLKKQPNLLSKYSDDHTLADYCFVGTGIVNTPSIDGLAKQGLVRRAGIENWYQLQQRKVLTPGT